MTQGTMRLLLSGAAVMVLAVLAGTATMLHDGSTTTVVLGMLALAVQNFVNQFPTEKGASDAERAKEEAIKAKVAAVAGIRSTDALTDSIAHPGATP